MLVSLALALVALPQDRTAQFRNDVLPVLQAKCFACHGDDPDDVRGKFDIRSRAGLLRGGESGRAAIVPGDPKASPLFVAITWQDDDLRMPKKKADRLTAAQIEAVRAWIADGAPWPASRGQDDGHGTKVATSGGMTADWTDRRYDPGALWAYRPVGHPRVPHDGKTGNTVHPIDAFIGRALAHKGLRPAPRADARTRIRRATFDLHGLPPTTAEIDAFVANDTPVSWRALVDRLLASPRYGERQAQAWLDITRYADTSGFANDHERPNAWRYRDYVIRSFNGDKPFDRFIVEQIAGDELDPDDPEMDIAVGFLRTGPFEQTGMSVAAVTRQHFLDDVTNHVGETFLGHSLRCARCHDHKFDPIPTRDYYRIQAVFAPTQLAERNTPFLTSESQAGFAKRRTRYAKLLAETNTQTAAIRKRERQAQIAWLRDRGIDPKSVNLARPARIPKDKRPPRNLGLSHRDLGVLKTLNKRRAYLERAKLRFAPMSLSIYDGPLATYNSNRKVNPLPKKKGRRAEPIQPVHILQGGALEAPLGVVTPGVLSAMHGSNDATAPSAWNTIPKTMRGRRLALARWIASPKNTLTARVIVNRIWQQHFGRGLVRTPNNFGKMGGRPTHPELLDWLAIWFVEHGWSIKQLNRLIMTSGAYARGGQHPAAAKVRRADPDNTLLATFPARRLTAEEIRDSMLAVSGELDFTMGGPGIRPEINMEVALMPRHIMGSVAPAYQPSRTPAERNRRTVYAFRIRSLPDPMLEVFNKPGPDLSCETRDATTVTPQVFALLNGRSAHARALAMAHRIARDVGPDIDKRIRRAFRLVYGRGPTESERTAARGHVAKMRTHHLQHTPPKRKLPTTIERETVEEMTGLAYQWTERLDIYEDYVPDLSPRDVRVETRALAELCLVLLNSNEFVYVY